MNFTESYPRLYQFFGGYFPDADLEKLTDEEVVANYIVDCNKSVVSTLELENVKKDILILMDDIELYWEDVMDIANRHFHNSNEALEWLNMIKNELTKIR